ncbi:uncharacterized protein BDZ83DRAFT_618082 [Colletotrichum acutatum]|uniref:Uncharacterized protein n=1 Tax=Glomerella acutata TaxID=27357 RepID=A0AAD8UPH6_GLOAC|nr:uncharacterized protein BDZ83DRAFT_618082 [Colletotrichum acutatum]KAK1725915.1 hypothetical protein BDZ83DRAFT_618082 [Colletotrichum acutatum]
MVRIREHHSCRSQPQPAILCVPIRTCLEYGELLTAVVRRWAQRSTFNLMSRLQEL